jgi:hypothetical protein
MREEVGADASLRGPTGKGDQKYLSSLIDARLRDGIETGPGADGAYKHHLALVRQPGAGAWLTAPPADDGRSMDTDLFRTALARRLRLRITEKPEWCPCCGEIFDTFGDHALACACGGDRTVRHNKFRNIMWEESRMAGMDTQKEKANLLPERPAFDGVKGTAGRRPADVWWKGGEGGKGVAWDFAVTSGMRADRLKNMGKDPGKIFSDYEDYKRGYKDTDELCKLQGFVFAPLVVEAHGGGWSGALRKTVDNIARRQRAVWSEGGETVSLRIAQRLSICLQAENARAVLRRMPSPVSEGEGAEGSLWEERPRDEEEEEDEEEDSECDSPREGGGTRR